jgi:hypothetical protein
VLGAGLVVVNVGVALVEVLESVEDRLGNVRVMDCSSARAIESELADGSSEKRDEYVRFMRVMFASATGFGAVAQQMLI